MTTDLPAGRELDALVAEAPYRCRKCGGSEFKVRKGGPTGLFRICPPCTSATRRALYARRADHFRRRRRDLWHGKKHSTEFRRYQRDWRLRKRYGMTEADFAAIREAQGGRCAICLQQPFSSQKGDRLHVDHDHITGRVRGLLCNACNVGLANFRDDPERMQKAAEYVRRAALKALEKTP